LYKILLYGSFLKEPFLVNLIPMMEVGRNPIAKTKKV